MSIIWGSAGTLSTSCILRSHKPDVLLNIFTLLQKLHARFVLESSRYGAHVQPIVIILALFYLLGFYGLLVPETLFSSK